MHLNADDVMKVSAKPLSWPEVISFVKSRLSAYSTGPFVCLYRKIDNKNIRTAFCWLVYAYSCYFLHVGTLYEDKHQLQFFSYLLLFLVAMNVLFINFTKNNGYDMTKKITGDKIVIEKKDFSLFLQKGMN